MDWSSCIVKVTDAATKSVFDAVPLQCLPVLFFNVISALFMFAGSVAGIMIMVGGFRFILAGGDAKQMEGAQATIKYAIFGLFIIFFSYLILHVITVVTGVSCILTIGPWLTGSCAQ